MRSALTKPFLERKNQQTYFQNHFMLYTKIKYEKKQAFGWQQHPRKRYLRSTGFIFFCGKTDFGHCLAIKNLNIPQSRFQVVRFAVFYYSRCKISASEVKAYAESQIPFAFLDSFFFFCGTFIKLHFGGIRFWEGINYFNIVRFNGSKCRWVAKQRSFFFFAF